MILMTFLVTTMSISIDVKAVYWGVLTRFPPDFAIEKKLNNHPLFKKLESFIVIQTSLRANEPIANCN